MAVDGYAPGGWTREPGTEIRTGKVSGPDSPFAIMSELEVPGVPLEWEPHTHHMHLLAWVRGGSMAVRLKGEVATVPQGWGLWLPAGTEHGGRLTAGVRFQSAYFAPGLTPLAFARPTVVAMNPVLESLLTYLVDQGLRPGARARAESVVFDVLEPAREQFTLPVPGDRRIRPVAEALLRDPGDGRTLEEWARDVGLSSRTVARAFRTATGQPFAQWRQALRIHRALALLAEGCGVQETSSLLGYAQPSTFISAFRRVMGTTPGAFMEQQRHSPI